MASTQLPSTLGAPTSQYRIQCNTSSVLIGDREFLSATDALEAYLSQYESPAFFTKQPKYERHITESPALFMKQPPYKRTVNDLLNPKSALHMTAERSLETGVRATDTELRLADHKDSINESLLNMKKSVSLKAEAKKNYYRKQRIRVEDALNKSQDLIRQIDTDQFPSRANIPSDVGSLATDVLVSIDPTEVYTEPSGMDTSTIPTWKSKHVFGYKRPRNRRSKTLSSIQIAHDMMGITTEQPQQSFTAQPNDRGPQIVTFQDNDTSACPEHNKYDDDVSLLLGTSPNTSRMSRSPAKTLRERSRSVSPSILKRERKLFDSGLRDKPIPDYYTDFNTAAMQAPSWVDTMNISDVSDTDWKKRDFTVSKPTPSWVNDIDNSDITSVVSVPSKKLAFHDLLRPLPVINTQNSSYNSATNDTLPPPGLTYKDLIGDTSMLNTSNTQNQGRSGQPTLSDKLNHLKSKTDAALERYHDRMEMDINADSPSKGSNAYSGDNIPRCSSLDTAALIAGILPPGDITGASPITPGDNDSRRGPGKTRRARSPDTDIVLEGDRPWERTVSYKAPVSVENHSKGVVNEEPNYSGGSQPGSLEALKNMIFKLQQEAVHTDSEDEGSRTKLSERVFKLRAEAASLGIQVPIDRIDSKAGKPSGDIPSLNGYDFQGEPGGQSLEKALVHLDRLKTLVHTQSGDGQTAANSVTPLCVHMEDKQ